MRQDIHVENVKDANAKAKDLLTKGITSLGFALEAENITPENIAILLSGIDVENVELNIRLFQIAKHQYRKYKRFYQFRSVQTYFETRKRF